jgi:dihydroorotase
VLNVHGIHEVRQMDIHMAEPLIPKSSLVEVEIAIGKLKSYKSPCTDQIAAKLIKAGGETLYSEIQKIICCIWNEEELPQQWKETIIVPIYKKGDNMTVIITEESPSYHLPTKFYLTVILPVVLYGCTTWSLTEGKNID